MNKNNVLSSLNYFKAVISQSTVPKEDELRLNISFPKIKRYKDGSLIVRMEYPHKDVKKFDKIIKETNTKNPFYISLFGIFNDFLKDINMDVLNIIYFPSCGKVNVVNKEENFIEYKIVFTNLPIIDRKNVFYIENHYNIELPLEDVIEKYNNPFDTNNNGIFDTNNKSINVGQYNLMFNEIKKILSNFKNENNKLKHSAKISNFLKVYKSDLISKHLIKHYNQSINYYKNNENKLSNISKGLFSNYINSEYKSIDLKYSNSNLENELFNKNNSFCSGQLLFKNVDENSKTIFGLNFNQKLFLYYACSDNYKEKIIALNGPPGTGKTTVLQDFVASKVTQAFLNKSSHPECFVGVSATNQARNNMIDGFKNKREDFRKENDLENKIPSSIKLSNNVYERWIINPWSEDWVYNIINYGIPLNKGENNFKDLFKNIFDKNNIKKLESIYIENYSNFVLNINDNCFDNLSNIFALKENKPLFNVQKLNNIKRILPALSNVGDVIYNILINFEDRKEKIIKEYDKLIFQHNKLKELYKIEKDINHFEEFYIDWYNNVKKADFRIKFKDFFRIKHDFYKNCFINGLENYDLDQILKFKLKEYVEANNSKKSIINLFQNIFILSDNPKNIFSYKLSYINKINSKNELKQLIKKIELDIEKENIFSVWKKHLINIKDNSLFSKNIEKIITLIDFSNNKEKIIKEANKQKLFIELSALIDNNIKYTLFHLSMRYFEGQFIEQSIEELFNKEYDNKTNLIFSKEGNPRKSDEALKKQYNLLSCISPFMVSTAHSIGSNFSAFGAKGNYPMSGFIDYVIFDEAGQCSPEIGGLTFTLAKRAIVVGDTKQIPPVWNIEDDFDLFYQNKFFNLSEGEKINSLSCCDSSVMAIAQKETFVRQADKNSDLDDGFYLLEHRRCPNQIIQYCNELKYDNELVLLPEKDFNNIKEEDLFLPNQKAWCLIDINKNDAFSEEVLDDDMLNQDEENGKSRKNQKEAICIVKYIKDNLTYFEKNNKNVEDVIAIVTPFKAQAQLIKKLLIEEVGKEKGTKITCGTVHSLQGAEKPVVLFSFVYTKNDNVSQYFIDRNDNIINVAVSRAKQSFYVFADKEALNKNSGKATNLLKQYLGEDSE